MYTTEQLTKLFEAFEQNVKAGQHFVHEQALTNVSNTELEKLLPTNTIQGGLAETILYIRHHLPKEHPKYYPGDIKHFVNPWGGSFIEVNNLKEYTFVGDHAGTGIQIHQPMEHFNLRDSIRKYFWGR